MIICIRGTESFADSLTDINAANIQFEEISNDCYSHEGILECCRTLFDDLEHNETRQSFLHQHEEYETIREYWNAVTCFSTIWKTTKRSKAFYNNTKNMIL